MIKFSEKYEPIINRSVVGVLMLLGLFLLVSIFVKVKEYRFVGSGLPAGNTISVVGEAEIDRVPDTAKISFTINNEQKEVKNAQNKVSEKVETITKELNSVGIEDRYIKTTSYNSYPQYDYPSCPNGICPVNRAPNLRGYEVSQTILVSIKDLERVSDVLSILGKNNVSNLNGPNFGFEDDKALEREARDLAIEDARGEAEKLAKSLGVKLVRIVSFSENGSVAPQASSYAVKEMSSMAGAADSISLPVGEHNIKSRVNVVYEIQ